MEGGLWILKDIISATGGEPHNQREDCPITAVKIDSRQIKTGDLFIALKGENNDAHDYVVQAINDGAVLAIVSEIRPEYEKLPVLLVADSFAALNDLAKFRRKNSSANFIAVTGSSGKTSLKEALKLVLSEQFRTYATIGNLNNHYGVPLCLANMPANVEQAIFELGMNHAGEILQLTKLVKPHIAIITNIAVAHIENFNSVEEIACAKAEIADGLIGNKILVLDDDDDFCEVLESEALKHQPDVEIMKFGMQDGVEFKTGKTRVNKDLGLDLIIDSPAGELSVSFPFIEDKIAKIVPMALAVCYAAGADLSKASAKLSEFSLPSGRGKMIFNPTKNIHIIDDSYNANPLSMKLALKQLGRAGDIIKGRKIAIIGDMLELGDESEKWHKSLATDIAENKIDKVFAIGTFMRCLFDQLPEDRRGGFYSDVEGFLAEGLDDKLQQNDTVLIKASRGMKSDLIVHKLEGSHAI
jgi:UDP-N-acetylmuramoyl-tripeptide--D-alanyl-D-alanine ligase